MFEFAKDLLGRRKALHVTENDTFFCVPLLFG